MTKIKRRELEIFAAQIRLETFREISDLGFGHIGGAMSIVDLLAVLYGQVMCFDPDNPDWESRDWLILSKGHSSPSLYAALALKGFFPLEQLSTLNRPGTSLPSHCSRIHTAGIDMTTGSLGQGISTANGVALASRIMGGCNHVFLILGDGELNEGQVWEGVLFAAHQKLSNLTMFIDANGKQLDGPTNEICALGDISKKFREFNWHVQEVDGHDVLALSTATYQAMDEQEKPSAIIMHTVKGKGCALAESLAYNHHLEFHDSNAIRKELSRLENVITHLSHNS